MKYKDSAVFSFVSDCLKSAASKPRKPAKNDLILHLERAKTNRAKVYSY